MSPIPVPFRRLSGHTVYTNALTAKPTVLDLGMHRGGFARAVEKIRPQAQIFGVEPQPDLARELAARYGQHVVQAAVGEEPGGEYELLLFDAADAATVRPPEGPEPEDARGTIRVPIVSLTELRERWRLPRIDVLKLDIEGLEVELLSKGPDAFSFACQLSVEFHAWRYPQDHARIASIIGRFQLGGWTVQDFSRVFDDVLFLNPEIAVSRPLLRGARLTMGARRAATRLIETAVGQVNRSG
jgi:FkbM family methyltransferase